MLRVTHRRPGPPPAGCLHALAPLQDDRAVLAYESAGTVAVTCLQAGGAASPLHVVQGPSSRRGPVADVVALAWAPSAARLAVAGRGRVDCYSWRGGPPGGPPGQLAHDGSCDTPDSCALAVSWTADGDGLLVCSDDATVSLWQARGDCGAVTPSSEALFDTATGRPDVLDVVWRTTLDTPQVIAAAGRHPADWVASCGREARHITVCVPNTRRFSGQPPHTQLQHPTPVLAAAWRPGAAASARVLLTFCSDGTARLWAQPPGSDAAGTSGMPPRLQAVACIAGDAGAPLASPPAWLTASPGAAPLLCGPGPDGCLHLWAVLCVDQPSPRPAVRVVPVSRTEAGVAAPQQAGALQLRLAPNARPGALPTGVQVWSLDGGGQASLVRAALASADQAGSQTRPPRESFGGGMVDAIAASVGGMTTAASPQAGVQRQPFPLDGHVGRITTIVAPPPGPPDTSTDDVLVLTLEGGGAPRLWRASCRGDITPVGLLPLFPETGQAFAAVSPSHSIFVVAATDGLAAYALRGRRTCTPFATSSETGGPVHALALLPPTSLVLGTAGHPSDAPPPCGIVAALTHGGTALRVWALQLTHAQAVGATLLAAWDVPSSATCLGAPPLLPHEDGHSLPYALATAGDDGVVRLWAPLSEPRDARQPSAWHEAGVCRTGGAAPRTLACSPGGAFLAVADATGGCALWACDSTACRSWTRQASLCAESPDVACVGIAWFHSGAAPPLLAVTRGDALQVWAPSRRRGTPAGSWDVLASTAATSQHMPLCSVAWHPYGALVASAGQELWAVSPMLAPPQPPGLDDDDRSVPLVRAVADVGGPAPAWHPLALGEAIRGGDVARAVVAVRTLADHLRELDTSPHPCMAAQLPDDAGTGASADTKPADSHASFAPGASLLEQHPSSGSALHAQRRAAPFMVEEAEEVAHLVSIAPAERLSSIQPEDTLAMLAALDALAQADSRRTDALALDAPAQRCVAELSYASLCERTGDPAGAGAARARASCWACHSSTQEPLLSACLGPGAAGMTWQAVRQCGAPTWLPSLAVLRTALETCARNLYMARKDPGDAAALYCALGRTQVLSALYRTAGDKQMPAFLSRDFSDPKNRMAASKNAYALLGMNKHGLAVAFFLLAGAPGDAASIAARRLHDPQLAVAIARLADAAAGDERAWGTTCESLAAEELLPSAQTGGDTWTHHSLLWRIGRTGDAIKLLQDAVSATMALPLQECSTLARLLGHLGDSVRLRLANPQDAAACSAASRLAAHMTACAASAAGMPLQGLTWLAGAAPESGDAACPSECLDAHACRSYQHSAAVRMAAAALWHGAAFEASLSPHSWQAGVANELRALRPLLPTHTASQQQQGLDALEECVLALLSRQLRVSQPPPPAPPLKTPSPVLVHSASATLTPPPAAVTMRKSITVDTMQTPTAATHSRTNSLVGALSRLPVSGASGFFGSSPSMPSLHRSMSAPTLQRDAVVAPPLEVLRAPGELLRGLAVLRSSPTVVAAATLRSGLLVSDVRAHDAGLGDAMLDVAGDGGGSDAAAWAAHGSSWAGHQPGARGQPPHGPASGAHTPSPSEVHVRCVAMHPNEPLLAAGSAAVGAGITLWRLSDRPSLRHVAPLPWPGHGGIAAAGPPVGAVTWDVSGARLGAAFADGTAAVWHVAAAGGAPYAWLSAFPGGMTHGITCMSPTVLALCGSGGDASLVLWDTLCPPKAQRVAAFAAHQGAPGASCLVRGCTSSTMVYTAGATAGDVAAFDLRAAAQSGAAAPLWRTPAGAVPASCLALAPWSSGDGTLFVGDRGGDLRVVEARTGRLLQLVAGAHPRAVFSPPQRIGGTAITAGVTSVLALPRGVLTCGADGALKLHAQETGAL